jgi:steroid Delta-isomerase
VPSLLEREVAAFNEGVRAGDWTSLVALFAEDGMLEFEGIPVGPFRGRDAIAEAYRAMPPDDEIVLLDGGPRYAWSKEPERPAGELHLEERDGGILRLRVLYERFS